MAGFYFSFAGRFDSIPIDGVIQKRTLFMSSKINNKRIIGMEGGKGAQEAIGVEGLNWRMQAPWGYRTYSKGGRGCQASGENPHCAQSSNSSTAASHSADVRVATPCHAILTLLLLLVAAPPSELGVQPTAAGMLTDLPGPWTKCGGAWRHAPRRGRDSGLRAELGATSPQYCLKHAALASPHTAASQSWKPPGVHCAVLWQRFKGLRAPVTAAAGITAAGSPRPF